MSEGFRLQRGWYLRLLWLFYCSYASFLLLKNLEDGFLLSERRVSSFFSFLFLFIFPLYYMYFYTATFDNNLRKFHFSQHKIFHNIPPLLLGNRFYSYIHTPFTTPPITSYSVKSSEARIEGFASARFIHSPPHRTLKRYFNVLLNPQPTIPFLEEAYSRQAPPPRPIDLFYIRSMKGEGWWQVFYIEPLRAQCRNR